MSRTYRKRAYTFEQYYGDYLITETDEKSLEKLLAVYYTDSDKVYKHRRDTIFGRHLTDKASIAIGLDDYEQQYEFQDDDFDYYDWLYSDDYVCFKIDQQDLDEDYDDSFDEDFEESRGSFYNDDFYCWDLW